MKKTDLINIGIVLQGRINKYDLVQSAARILTQMEERITVNPGLQE